MLVVEPTATEDFLVFLSNVKTVLRWILSPELQRQLFPLKFVFIIFGIGFLVMIVYFTLKTSYMEWWFMGFMKNFLFPKVFERKILIRKWKKIKKGIQNEIPERWKLSIIAGANLIDKVLKDAGYGGDNLEERLRRVDKEEIINLDKLKEAQQIVYNVTSDPDYKLTKQKAEEVIDIFEDSLTDMGIL